MHDSGLVVDLRQNGRIIGFMEKATCHMSQMLWKTKNRDSPKGKPRSPNYPAITVPEA